MAYPVYSTAFAVHASGDPLPTFDVPSGYVAVIRFLSGFSTASIASLQALAQDSSLATAVVVAQVIFSGLEEYQQWQGRVVVPGGGLITFAINGFTTGCDFYCGGYLLFDSPGP